MWWSFVVTQLLELPMFHYFNRTQSIFKNLLNMFTVNCITWPIATLLWTTTSISLIPLEFMVVAAETLLFKYLLQLTLKDAIKTALIINAISTLVGFLIPNYYEGRI